jgi:hypothetical protein
MDQVTAVSVVPVTAAEKATFPPGGTTGPLGDTLTTIPVAAGSPVPGSVSAPEHPATRNEATAVARTVRNRVIGIPFLLV